MLLFPPKWRRVAMALPHLLTLPLAMGLSSCIPIPIEFEDEELFEVDQVAFIEIGKSTKADISAAIFDLANETDNAELKKNLTPKKYQDGNWWLYTQLWSSDRWMFLPLFPTFPVVSGEYEYRFLLINFDDKDIVSHYEMSTLQGNECNRSGICKRGSEFILLGRSEDVRLAKLSESPADKCGVYLYTKVDFAIPIERDGSLAGRLVDDEHFLYWQLDPGTYELKSLSLDRFGRGPIEFDCAVGDLYFFEFQRRTKGVGVRRQIWVEIKEQDPVEGRQAIDNRQLMLSVAPVSD
jgi:hypothetical protein